MLLRLLLFLCVAACSTGGAAFAQLDVRVQLILQSDIEAPDGDWKRLENFDIVITIVNGTSTAADVPKTYSPNRIRLCASGSNGTHWPLHLGSRQETGMIGGDKATVALGEETVTVAPGKKYEVLRVSAKVTLISPGNIYAETPLEEFAKRRWVWNWGARPGPDYSPFESRKGDGRSEHAVLWCELDVKGRTIRSVPQIVNATHYNPG
ncbi:hypothetical protein [Novipirellula rosea]|uniref:hypothetical protein n=1 Tax=Novipirellula rosea TaxID=1031540 RepID=UPI0031E69FF3